MNIRFAGINEYPSVVQLYQACGYGGGVDNEDKVVIAEASGQLIGAVRICTEQGVQVLRGMQIIKSYHGKGIGSLVLQFLKDNIVMTGCYCLPYKHLTGFYGQIGFELISADEAPVFLAERLEKYLSIGNREMVMMKVMIKS